MNEDEKDLAAFDERKDEPAQPLEPEPTPEGIPTEAPHPYGKRPGSPAPTRTGAVDTRQTRKG